jgi:hypothetical protein
MRSHGEAYRSLGPAPWQTFTRTPGFKYSCSCPPSPHPPGACPDASNTLSLTLRLYGIRTYRILLYLYKMRQFLSFNASGGYSYDDLPRITTRTFIGIVVAISGNVLISLALNLQKLAHKRVEERKEDSDANQDERICEASQ